MEFDSHVDYILEVLKKDLNLNDTLSIKETVCSIDDRYKHRPSSLLLAVIETMYPEKKALINMTHNVSRQTINQVKNELLI